MPLPKRSEHLEKSLLREINNIIYRKINDPRIKFVTLTRVKVSSDLKYADIFVTIFNDKKQQRKALEGLKKIKTTINIDHHASNESFGDLNYVDSSVSSVGEIIYELIRFINVDLLDKDISTYLFTSILTDTGSFR